MSRSSRAPGISSAILAVLASGSFASAQGAGDNAMQDRVRVAVETAGRATVGQPLTVTVRFELEQQFLREHAVDLLQRPVDLPVQLVLPWAVDPDPERVRVMIGTVDPTPGERAPTVAVANEVVRARTLAPIERDGRTFEAFAVPVRWTGLAAGDFECAGTALRYAFTTRFEETLLSGRQPVDRIEGTATAPPFTLTSAALPTGAPAGFTGAVGQFTIRVIAEPTRVELGDNFELALAVSGDGNLTEFEAPDRPELRGFAVQGLVERSADGERVFAFDVLALREGAAQLSLPFVFFDPAVGAYRTLRSEPVAVSVEPRAANRPLPERVAKLIAKLERAGDGIGSDNDSGVPMRIAVGIGAALVCGLVGLVVLRRRRSAGSGGEPTAAPPR